MNDRQLRYALTVWRERSFSKAAPKLNVSQPAISDQIRLLEEELGFELLGASFDPRNHASMRVAAKAGFQFARTGLDEHCLSTLYYELGRPEGTP